MNVVSSDPGSQWPTPMEVRCRLCMHVSMQGLKQHVEVNVKMSAVFWTLESNTRTCSGEYTYIQYHRRMCPAPAIPSAYRASAENVRKSVIWTDLISQYFDLKHFLVNYNAASILTPPNALKLVTFDQYPEFLRKSEGCRDNSVSTCALLIRSMRYTFDDYSEWVRASFSSIFGAQAVPLSWPRRSGGEPGDTAGPSGSEAPTADSLLSMSTVSVDCGLCSQPVQQGATLCPASWWVKSHRTVEGFQGERLKRHHGAHVSSRWHHYAVPMACLVQQPEQVLLAHPCCWSCT